MTIHNQLLFLSQKYGMPEIFAAEDLAHDKRILERFQGSEFIWLLRTCGTALIPLRKGANPVHVTYWVEPESKRMHGQKILAFHIKADGKVIQIPHNKVLELAVELPMISFHNHIDSHLSSVTRLLEDGRELSGVFGSPDIDCSDWGSWADYFRGPDPSSIKNPVMYTFMRKAIKHAALLINGEAA